MVFSSFPTYPDSSNWQQQHQPVTSTVGFTGNNNINQQFLPPPQPQPLQTPGGGPGGPGGSIRPGSMAERARLANIPLPETPLKCPRCDSTNTKFCYFNNYSLTQPRHFCKSCRRYWTRGGALRSVPVGGGCRRNKRTKNISGGGSSSSGSKSQDCSTTSNDQYHHRANQMGPPSSLSALLSSYNAGLIPGHDHNNNNILGLGSSLPPLKLRPPLDFGDNFNTIQYGAVSAPSFTGLDQRIFPVAQQVPNLGGYGWDQHQPSNICHNFVSSSSCVSSAIVTATASVKMEDSNNQLNLCRQQLFGNEQEIWNIHGAAATTSSSWSDFSNNFSSSSTSNIINYISKESI